MITTKLIPILLPFVFYGLTHFGPYLRRKREDNDLVVELLDGFADIPELGAELLSEALITSAPPGPAIVVGGIEYDNTPVRDRRHRRLPRSGRRRNKYVSVVVAEVKAKVGTPTDKEANRLVIRRIARGIMESHGLRPTHQQVVMPHIIECVLLMSAEEVEAKRWANSLAVSWRRKGHHPWWSFLIRSQSDSQ